MSDAKPSESDPSIEYGVSFSAKYCKTLGVSPKRVLKGALKDLGVRRLRLMSYWDELQPKRDVWKFEQLDWQLAEAARAGASVTLAIGMRQPRWPECHVPEWASELPEEERLEALMDFLRAVVRRYRDTPNIVSYQLENEALNRGIGTCTDYSRSRLRQEFRLVKDFDRKRPVLMSLSNSYGLPLSPPLADGYGFSIYRHQHNGKRQTRSRRPAWTYRLHAGLIRLMAARPTFVHELQAEPWGDKSTQELTRNEQDALMNTGRFREALKVARKAGFKTIDLWGLEWWYWRKTKLDDPAMWNAAREVFGGAQETDER